MRRRARPTNSGGALLPKPLAPATAASLRALLGAGVEPMGVILALPVYSNFTDTSIGFSITLLNAAIDLVSFSGILYRWEGGCGRHLGRS